MSELTNFVVLAKFNDRQGATRLARYLDEDTRPDFPEEVPESESQWVDIFYALPDAETEVLNDTVIARYADESDITQAPDEILAAMALTGPRELYFYACFDDNVWYGLFADGKVELLWAVDGMDDPDDDAQLNQRLSEATRMALRGYDDPASALQYLSQQ